MAKDALYSERNAKSNCLTTELSQVEPAMHGCDSNYEFSRLLFILCICQSSGSEIYRPTNRAQSSFELDLGTDQS